MIVWLDIKFLVKKIIYLPTLKILLHCLLVSIVSDKMFDTIKFGFFVGDLVFFPICVNF